jgi:hypothetical protein
MYMYTCMCSSGKVSFTICRGKYDKSLQEKDVHYRFHEQLIPAMPNRITISESAGLTTIFACLCKSDALKFNRTISEKTLCCEVITRRKSIQTSDERTTPGNVCPSFSFEAYPNLHSLLPLSLPSHKFDGRILSQSSGYNCH